VTTGVATGGAAATTQLVIVGAGGFGRETHDVWEAQQSQRAACGLAADHFIGFLDDAKPVSAVAESRGAWLGSVRGLESLPPDVRYVIAIGDGAVRRQIDEWAQSIGRQAAEPLIHPAATVGGRGVLIGAGSVICAGARITTDVTLGRHVHLNLNATVGHDASVGDYVTVNPGATVSGNVTIGDEVVVGTGAAIIQGVKIGGESTIGAGASVIRDIPPRVTAVGVPAKPLAAH
jgi:sugar O-acyltransferase (sialic acid O-acetyltransferase NeuD family)